MAMELAMIENLQREDLNPIEEAKGFQSLMEDYGMTQAEVAESVGKSRSAVANALRLLDLHFSIQRMVESGALSVGHAKVILPLSPSQRVKAVGEIERRKLSVRETEQLVKRMLSEEKKEEKEKPEVPAVDYAAEAAKSLSTRLGRACRISQGKKKGKIEIEYYGVDDLNDLLEALEGLGK